MFQIKWSQLLSFVIVIALLIFNNQISYGQQDTIETTESVQERLARERKAKKAARRQKFLSTLPKNHNPKTATLLALIPGAGQIYNRRYWKLPIVYAGVGVLGYFMVSNYVDYSCFRRAYLDALDTSLTNPYICPSQPDATANQLKIYRDNAQSTAETFLLGFTLFYGLTIVDAFVDAHLMHFDIDDDLSMHIRPAFNYDMGRRTVMPSLGLTVYARPKTALALPVQF